MTSWVMLHFDSLVGSSELLVPNSADMSVRWASFDPSGSCGRVERRISAIALQSTVDLKKKTVSEPAKRWMRHVLAAKIARSEEPVRACLETLLVGLVCCLSPNMRPHENSK